MALHDPTARTALPATIRAAIFDMDGTLLDTEAMHRRSFAVTGEALGWPLDESVQEAMIGVHREENERMLAAHFGPDFPLSRFYEDADALFAAELEKGVPLRPGAKEILEQLADMGVALALATSTASPFAEQRLERAGLARFFDVVVTRNDVTNAKPDPEPYRLAARRLGVDPCDAIAIEDSNPGVRSATGAGIATIMVPDMMQPDPDVAALATRVLPSLDALQLLVCTRAFAAD